MNLVLNSSLFTNRYMLQAPKRTVEDIKISLLLFKSGRWEFELFIFLDHLDDSQHKNRDFSHCSVLVHISNCSGRRISPNESIECCIDCAGYNIDIIIFMSVDMPVIKVIAIFNLNSDLKTN